MTWERMLHFCPAARFQMLQLFEHAPRLVRRKRFALGTLHRHMPRYGLAAIFFTLFNTLVTSVAERRNLVTVQQRRGRWLGRRPSAVPQQRAVIRSDARRTTACTAPIATF